MSRDHPASGNQPEIRSAAGLWKLFLLCGALMVSGCAAKPPLAEVRIVGRAFDDLNAASQPLIDDLALAERAQGKAAAEARARERAKGRAGGQGDPGPCAEILLIGGEKEGWPEVQNGFCPPDSYYYSELADPPATRAFRHALAAIGAYTRLLLLLAEGGNIEQARGQLQTLAGNLGTALQAAGVTGAGLLAKPVLEALNPLIELAARDANAEELERVVREEAPKVVALLEALRIAAPELFTTLTETAMARFNESPDNQAIANAEAARIEAYRVAVSNYVVLLEQYRRLLNELVAAYSRPGGSLSLGYLAEQSAELSARAEAWRRSLASLRSALR
jgi:hypothetical protein